MKSCWREAARPIILDIIKRVGIEDEKALKKALMDAYPFGERSMHPYKIWRDEIKNQIENIRKMAEFRRRSKDKG